MLKKGVVTGVNKRRLLHNISKFYCHPSAKLADPMSVESGCPFLPQCLGINHG